MDYLQQLIRQAKLKLAIVIFAENLLIIGGWIIGKSLTLSNLTIALILIVLSFAITFLIAAEMGKYLLHPISALWDIVGHLSPDTHGINRPEIESLGFGKNIVGNISAQIYQLITSSQKLEQKSSAESKDLNNNFIAKNLPLPLFVLDETETIKYANQSAAEYMGIDSDQLIGKNVYMVVDMSFPSEDTFDNWLKKAKIRSAVSMRHWERVRLNVRDSHPLRLFDLAAFYNKSNPDKFETMMILFDHTKQYEQDDQAINFLALSVHELRAPLTLLRGYIEVFEEELEGSADPELTSFMEKMHAQAEQLVAFINNILNVARVDEDQLELKLEETDWVKVLKSAIEAISLRAKIRGITLHCTFAKDLPTVGVDQLSIKEVVSNLIDNAIKYSGKSKDINIETKLNPEKMVETSVQDYGLGIPSSTLPNLFTKFYRDHHNRAQIGGTGLGLYLSKAIVKAHGGNLWIRSKEGEGSTFGFTLLPYEKISEESKKHNFDITRNAHGWIKNHSLTRR